MPCGLNEPTAQEVAAGKIKLDPSYYQPCNQCDLLKLLKNIIDFVLIGLMPPAAAILFVWGGFLILMGGANPGWITQGKSIFWNTAVGVAIILASWLITNTIIRSIAADNIAPEWWKFECRVTVAGPVQPPGPQPQPPIPQPPVPQPPAPVPQPQPATLAINTSSLSDARQDFNYSQTVQATGGKTPYNWSVSGSAQLPSGLFINGSTGEIFGKPTISGTFTFTVMVEDSSSPQKSTTKQLNIKVVAPAASVVISNVASSNITTNSVTITWATDKPSTSQVAYGTTISYGPPTSLDSNQVTSHSVTIIGLTAGTTYNYQAISSITGFIARSSNYTFKTTGTSVQPISITTTSLAGATQNQSYSQTLSATGGTAPYSWSVSSGTLPTGLNLNSSSGNISGTPTTAGTSTFTVKVTDNFTPQQSATKQFTIVVMENGTLACMFNGVNYSTLNLCSGQRRPGGCGTSTCSQYLPSIQRYAGGAATVDVLKTFMVIESDCNIKAATGTSYGLMQISPATGAPQSYKCGININTTPITQSWLTDPANADKSICLGAEIIRSIAAGTCGSQPRNIYAGYNAGPGYCAASRDCAGEQSCGGGVKKGWECPYDNVQHTICNTGMYQTKQGATYINYCLNNLSF